MSLNSTAIVTGDIGPGVVLTAKVFTKVSGVVFDFDKQVLTVDQSGTKTAVDITDQATITITVSSGVYTLSVS